MGVLRGGVAALVFVVLGAVAVPDARAAADCTTPLAVAAALSGRDVSCLPGGAEGRTAAQHTKRMKKYWDLWTERVGAPLEKWARATVTQQPGGTVFYPFSGPDFATAHRLWPDASRYVFVAYQRAGRMPTVEEGKELYERLRLFQEGLRSFASLGFFVTTEMNAKFGAADSVEGILGILLLFADLEGFDVLSVQPIRIADDGRDVVLRPDDGRSAWNSVRLSLRRRADGGNVTLDYVRIDLLDRKLRERPHQVTWLEDACQHPVLLKSASHLLQRPGFRVLRDLLLDRAPSILQDESGLPIGALQRRYAVEFFGRFKEFHERFDDHYEKELQEAFAAAGDVPRLPFRLGYDKRKASCFIYARARK